MKTSIVSKVILSAKDSVVAVLKITQAIKMYNRLVFTHKELVRASERVMKLDGTGFYASAGPSLVKNHALLVKFAIENFRTIALIDVTRLACCSALVTDELLNNSRSYLTAMLTDATASKSDFALAYLSRKSDDSLKSAIAEAIIDANVNNVAIADAQTLFDAIIDAENDNDAETKQAKSKAAKKRDAKTAKKQLASVV